MRIPCPFCGERDVSEFSYRGDATPRRPEGLAADPADMARYVYERDNPAGPIREHWQHVGGCRAWLVVTRDTRDHAIAEVVPVRSVQ